MRIFIIGATGFIGRHLIEALKEEHELILLHRGRIKNGFVADFPSIISNRNHLLELKPQINDLQPEVVIDLIPYFAQHAWDILNTFRDIAPHVIALSSGDVYRAYEIFKDRLPDFQEQPLTEKSLLRENLFPYRGSQPEDYLLEHYEKILVESILQNQDEIDTTILRLGAVYGPHDTQHKLEEYIRPLLNNKKLIIDQSKASWRWTRIYVEEVALAIKLVLKNLSISRNLIFNVGELHTISQLELIKHIQNIIGVQKLVEVKADYGNEPFNYRQDIILDSSKFRSHLNYSEKYTLEEGLTETIQYERSRQD